VLAVRREGRLVALAPFLIYGAPRTVAFCGGGVSDYCDVVTDHEEAMMAIWAHLEKRRDLWQVGDFEPLPDSSPLLRGSPASEPRDVCPGLDLPERVEDLGDVVPTRQLSNLRKYRRKAGDLRLITEPWEELLDIVLRLYRHGPLSEELRAFHREVAAGFHARDALGLYALCLDSHPLAALYGFREGNTFYCYMQGFDPAYAKLSPGVMIVGSVIEDAIRRGARRIDFLRGREEYKYWWGAKDRETFRVALRT
jgi:CelD/BcsL family acetyltransferase involved in cellulose biosynthesis